MTDVTARMTERGRKVLELSLREALSLGHNYIGTEHILLGLVREGEGLAFKVLVALGATPDAVRNEVIRQLTGPNRKAESESLPSIDISLAELLRRVADHLEHNTGSERDS